MPLAARFVLGTPRLVPEEGQGRWLRAPCFQCLAPRTGTWHEGYQALTLCSTQAARPAPLRLAIRHDPVDALQAQSAALRKRHWRLHTVTRMPIPPPASPRHPAIATHA